MKTCGNCKHWVRAQEYRWGNCCYEPMPLWVYEAENGCHNDRWQAENAEDCDAYEEEK